MDGARGFLVSRDLRLPEGNPADPPGQQTVWAVANRKNELFGVLLDERGVRTFASSVDLVHRLRAAGLYTAVVTASRNAVRVLAATGLAELFDVRVDGEDAAALGLPGKPDPATYLEAIRRLHVPPDRSVIVEDALAGVEAGRRGGFGLVVGVDRKGHRDSLDAAGADIVVADLEELPLELVRPRQVPGMAVPDQDFCVGGRAGDGWVLSYDGYDPAREGLRETLCATGNGYLCTRGAVPECVADGVHYPGSYLAGVYNRLVTTVGDRTLEHEHLVNVPNWLPLQFRVAGGEWFSPDTADLTAYRTELDLRTGVLTRLLRFRDPQGGHTTVRQRRLVHMDDPHLATLETVFTAEDWSGQLQVRSGVDGTVINGNLPEDEALARQHLQTESAAAADYTAVLTVVTTQSRTRIAMAARTVVRDRSGQPLTVARTPALAPHGFAGQLLDCELEQGEPLTVEKVVAVATSRDPAVSEPALAAREAVHAAGGFAELLAAQERAWGPLWERFDLAVDADDEVVLALRLHTFHLLQTLSPHTAQLDAGVPARGLHGEGYHGHVFWDEMFVFPVLNLRLPTLSRALLLYRWRRLDAARRAARQAGRTGSMFPWESASDGREETPTELYDLVARQWIANLSHLQRHVGIAIVFDTWQYYQVTGDVDFLTDYGAEMIIEIARYLAGLVAYDPGDDRYGISGVVGPDEYHTAYPDATEPGLRDNAYTNVMTAWVLSRALDVIALLAGHRGRLWAQLGLDENETRWWERISRRMRVPFHDGVISQFAGYGQLAEFDWDAYRQRHGDLLSVDAVLRAEGDSPNRYKLSKQADVLMLLYLLSAEELRDLFARLGYQLDAATIERTVAYYLARVAHGSSLSRIAHSWVQARADRERSWTLFTEALRADLADTREGSTRGGVHLGAMAGTIDLAMRCYTGLETRDDILYLDPVLPAELRSLHVEVLYRGHWVVIDAEHRRLRVGLRPCQAAPIRISFASAVYSLAAGQHREFHLAT